MGCAKEQQEGEPLFTARQVSLSWCGANADSGVRPAKTRRNAEILINTTALRRQLQRFVRFCYYVPKQRSPYPFGMGYIQADSRARFSHCSTFTPLIKSHKASANSEIRLGTRTIWETIAL